MATRFLALFLAALSLQAFQAAQQPSDQISNPSGHRLPPMRMPANPNLPTLYIIGDSTVRNGQGDGRGGLWGWGDLIGKYFDPAKINVVNWALGGRSSRTYITEGHWSKLLAILKPGDFVMMQFGHNDSSPVNDTSRARGTLKGTGHETHEIDNLLTGKHETVHTFGWYMRKYITDTKAKGATPIVCSMIPRKIWKDGKIVRNSNDYAGWAKEVAAREGVPFIDLNDIIADKYDSMEPAAVNPLFGDEHTHTTRAGAELNAKCVIEGLKALPNDPLKPYFSSAADSAEWRFDFGDGKTAPGYRQVTASTWYSDQLGYGLEPGASVKSVDRGGEDPLDSDLLTSAEPFYFSVRVPEEGNYKVTVRLGDRDAAAAMAVKAELRRLMLEDIRTAPGQFVTRSFLVNVRTPEIAGDGTVRLKPRETTTEAWAWDNKLTLEFIGARPAVCGVVIQKDDSAPTLYIAGDSTSTDQPKEPYNSWGQMLPVFFKPEIAIANNGESGESARSFITENRLAKVMSVIKPGDWLFIQFGHNDQKEKGPGVGAFTTYETDLKRLVAEARQHGATPVLITPVNRLTFGSDGKIRNSLGDFPAAVRQTAQQEHVPLIDLNAMSAKFYEALGPQNAHEAFAGKDTTHHGDYGSYELAKCIVQGIKDDGLPIAKYLYPTARFDPAHPDPIDSFSVPAEPAASTERPYGN